MHLNLDLMKWRAIPSLDTGKLRQLKCLMLGAGVARCMSAVAGVVVVVGARG